MLREADRFLNDVQQAIGGHLDDPRAAPVGGLEVFLRAAADDPFVRTITSGVGADELLPLLTVQGEPLFVHATERLAAVLVAGWPGVAEADARQLADVAVRLAVSYAASPAGPPEATAAGVARLLEPFVLRAVELSGAAPRSARR